MIRLIASNQVISDDDFFARYPNIAFPVPLTDEALADFGASLVPEDIGPLMVEARARINAWRDDQESLSVTFSFDGCMFDADLSSKNRIAQVLEIGALPPGFYWTDADNNDVPMDIDNLRLLADSMTAAIVSRGWQIHRRQRELKATIATMTAGQLKAFVPNWE